MRYFLRTLSALVLLGAGCLEDPEQPKPPLPLPVSSLELLCDPCIDSLKVFLDGRYLGNHCGAYSNIAPGRHVLDVQAERYESKRYRFSIQENATVKIRVSMRPKPFVLTFRSTPSGAQVWIDGRPSGQVTPVTILHPSSSCRSGHHVRLTLADQLPWSSQFEALPADTLSFDASLDQPAPSFKIVYATGQSAVIIDADGTNPLVLPYRDPAVGREPQGRYVGLSYNMWDAWWDFGFATVTRSGTILSDTQWLRNAPSPSSWSSTGRELVYGRAFRGIYVYSVASRQEWQLFATQGYTYDHDAVFLPGDSLIAFVNHSGGIRAIIRLINRQGRGLREVTTYYTDHDEWMDLQVLDKDRLVFKTMGLLNLVHLSRGQSEVVAQFDQPITTFRLSWDRRQFAVSAGSLYIGSVDDWSHRRIGPGAWFIEWAPDGEGLVICEEHSIVFARADGQYFTIAEPTDRIVDCTSLP